MSNLVRFLNKNFSNCLVVLAVMVSLTPMVNAEKAPRYLEGADYTLIEGIPEDKSPMVREFFSYNCSHCYRQDSIIEAAINQLGKSVSFDRTPVGAGRKTWVMSQEAYYIANKFRMTNQVHHSIFTRIHEQGLAFSQPQQLKDFFIKQGLSATDFDTAIASIDLKLGLRNYDAQAQLAQIRGVPALLVNGKYLLNAKTRTPEDLAAIIQFLVNK